MRFPVVLTAYLIKSLMDNQHIISAAIIDDTHNVIAIAGDTVRLNCTGGKQWRGPNVKKGTIPYFDLYAINPAVTIQNIKLDVSRGQYDLVISNISKENIGLYACQSLDTSLMISIEKYRVSLSYDRRPYTVTHTTTAEDDSTYTDPPTTTRKTFTTCFFHSEFSSTFNAETSPEIITIRNQSYNFELVFTVTALVIVLALLGIVMATKKYNSCFLQKLNTVFYHIYTTQTTHDTREEIEESVHTMAVENSIYQSAVLPVNSGEASLQLQDTMSNHDNFHFRASHEPGPAGERTGRQLQRTDQNLHYADILHAAMPDGYRHIHGIGNRTIYSEINHLLSADRMPDIDNSD